MGFAPKAVDGLWSTVKVRRNHARLRAFPPQAVLGPCFSTGLRSPVFQTVMFSSRASVTPVDGRPVWRRGGRRPASGPDNPIVSLPRRPGVNAGPNTAFGGKGRKRPSNPQSPIPNPQSRANILPSPACGRGVGGEGSLPRDRRALTLALSQRERGPNILPSPACGRGAGGEGSQSPAPHAFTLIEMMIVITIMLILVAAAATMMRPDLEGRRVREAARSINLYLNSARNHAMETGRPCGVTLRLLTNGSTTVANCAASLDQCEEPPSYCGLSESSVAGVWNNGGNVTVTLYSSSSGADTESLSANMVVRGDMIQLNYQGPIYTITGDPSGGTFTLTEMKMYGATPTVLPWPTTSAAAVRVPFRIYRSPVKGGAEPLQLPAGTVVDLTASGYGTQ